MEHLLGGRIRAASALASKYMAVVESLGDPVLTAELARPACVAKLHAGDIADVHRWAEAMISTTDGSPHLESTLSIALVFRAVARWTVGEPAWQDDMDRAVAVSRTADVVSQATVIAYKYTAIARGIVLADDTALAEIEDAIRMADRSSDETALILIRTAQGIVLVHHGAERLRGYRILAGLRDTCMRECYALNTVPILQVYGARECVDRGDIDDGIEQLRSVCDRMVDAGNIGNLDVAVVALVEALLARGTVSDIADAEQALGLLDAGQDGTVWASRAVTALRLRALIARARGDEPTYRSLEDEHRQWSTELGFRGHLAWSRTLRD
jgi:adenylate cyclase